MVCLVTVHVTTWFMNYVETKVWSYQNEVCTQQKARMEMPSYRMFCLLPKPESTSFVIVSV